MAKRTARTWWRPWVSGLCVAIAAVAVVGTVVTRYIERNLLDTEGYLAIVGPLPENPQVATALAAYTTTKAFDAADAQANIAEFLPPRLEPLAAPLTDALEERTNQIAKTFIQSDAFAAIWTAANQVMQRGVVRLAQSEQGEGRLAAVGQLDLGRLVGAVRERLGQEPSQTQQARAATIQLNLRQSVERLRTTYDAITAGAYMLPYVAAAFLLAALVVAYNRRRAVIAIGCTILLVGVAMLVAFKITSGGILDDIGEPTYNAAAQAIYEAFYADLRSRLIGLMIVGGALIVLALLAGPYAWARWLRTKFGLAKLKKIEPYRWARNIRHWTARYEPWLLLAGLGAVIIWLLVLSTLTPATLVVILSLLITYASFMHLIARPPPSHTLL